MNPSRIFIERPVATTLLTVAVAIAGTIAFVVLPVSPLPQVDFPTITVAASLPGASPDIMASSIATPLERQFGHIAGITEMTSSSTLGTTGVTLQFDLSRDINGAARDVEAGINAARTYLPSNLPANPTYRKVNPADSPIMVLGLQSDIYDVPELYDEASTVMEQRISQISGVGEVLVVGASLPAVRIELNPNQLASYGISLPAVQQVVAGQNSNLAKGQFFDGHITADIVANDQISKAADYKPLVIGYHNGGVVRLQDVADVIDTQQSVRQAGFLNGKPSVNMIIFRQPGANIIKTVDLIKAAIPSLQATIKRGQHLVTILDRTLTIRASVSDIERTLIISVVLVIAVVFIFLRNVRATLIPAVAVPVSLIGTCAIMYLAGFSLDNLSLMALAIASGFVVDDAIVVMENITRHLEAGMSPIQAALKGAEEIGFTVFSISVSLIAVFIPLLLMGGIIGRLFREFAITLSAAIMVSMLVSLTTTPMMCGRVLVAERDMKHGRLYTWSERAFDSLLGGYKRSLTWVLDHPALIFDYFRTHSGVECFPHGENPQRIFPAAGHRCSSGRTARAPGHLVLRNGESRQAIGGYHQGRPWRAERDGLHRRPGRNEYRQRVHSAEAARTAQGKRYANHQSLAAKAGWHPRSRHISAGRPGYPYRRPASERRVSVHPASRNDARSPKIWTAASGAITPRAWISGCEYRPAEQWPSGFAHLRSPHRGASGRHSAGARQHALRCVRPGRGLHHLYAVEPILRRDGGGSEILAVASGLEADVPDPKLRRRRHPSRFSGSIYSFNVAARGEPHGTFSVRYGVVQSCTGRFARSSD
jgi:hypothetical protein